MNARRPVDFYDPGQETTPHNLPGCTTWEKADSKAQDEQFVGVLWLCKALTVLGEPVIQFRASKSSASNEISSTKIRKIMCESPDAKLYELLKDKVLGVEPLVEWLKRYKGYRGVEGEGAY